MKIFLDANICLDLLDTSRPTSKISVKWYLDNKDNKNYEFYFSGDFITTFYYILTEKRKHNAKDTLHAIDTLSDEILAHYITHKDFKNAKNQFFDDMFNDFEDLLILSSADRIKCDIFMTNDKELLTLDKYFNIKIQSPDFLYKQRVKYAIILPYVSTKESVMQTISLQKALLIDAYKNSLLSLEQLSKSFNISKKESLKLLSLMGIAVVQYEFEDDLRNMDIFIQILNHNK